MCSCTCRNCYLAFYLQGRFTDNHLVNFAETLQTYDKRAPFRHGQKGIVLLKALNDSH